MKIATRSALIRLLILAALMGSGGILMFRMPGRSYTGPRQPLTDAEARRAETLRRDVLTLAGDIGERNLFRNTALREAERFIRESFVSAGYTPTEQEYTVAGQVVRNLEAELRGTSRPEEIVVVGAHYDSVLGSPGANDNGSGVAVLLELARAFAGKPAARTLRFVAFVNEEPPLFKTENMGSLRYARRCRERGEKVVGMISLETMGCYSDRRGSQAYPFPLGLLYPDTGNFIAFISNFRSASLLRRAIRTFRSATPFPSEGAILPGFVTGVSWSDHWSFWKAGYPAIMVTDTALFRFPEYHTPGDQPETVDFERLAVVVGGMERVVEELARADE